LIQLSYSKQGWDDPCQPHDDAHLEDDYAHVHGSMDGLLPQALQSATPAHEKGWFLQFFIQNPLWSLCEAGRVILFQNVDKLHGRC